MTTYSVLGIDEFKFRIGNTEVCRLKFIMEIDLPFEKIEGLNKAFHACMQGSQITASSLGYLPTNSGTFFIADLILEIPENKEKAEAKIAQVSFVFMKFLNEHQ